MCDRLSDAHGYICEECFDELCNSGVQTDIEEFMNSKKKDGINKDAAEQYFKIIFPSRYYDNY
jgi:hypothetical protein